MAGTLGAVVPGLPELALFVAPALLDAALEASPRDLRDDLLPVGGLAVVAVLLTAGAVAARWLVPEMPWAAAVALGAVVAQRLCLDALRSGGRIGDGAFHQVEEEIDLMELTADPRLHPGGAA